MTVSELMVLFGVYTDDRNHDRISPAEALTLFNRGQEKCEKLIRDADEGYFRGCETFAVEAAADSSYEFDLPSDFITVHLAERVTGNTPVPAVWPGFKHRHNSSGIIGPSDFPANVGPFQPKCYLSGNKIGVVEPSGSFTLRLWYNKRLVALANLSDESDVPAEHHNLIALHAARLAVPSEDTWSYENQYQDEVGELRAFIEQRQRQEPRHVHYTEDDAESYY
jgi:hypothetical protein